MGDNVTATPQPQRATSGLSPGRFFPLDINAVREIARQGGGAEEVAAYIVLAAHTQGQGPSRHRLSSAGVKAVYTYTGMPIRRAQKAVKSLVERKFITHADEVRKSLGDEQVPHYFGKSKVPPRFFVHGEQHDVVRAVNIPQSLIRGVLGAAPMPPLARLYQQVETDSNADVTLSEARLDALMLLFYLYQHHRVEECGGIDPRAGLYRRWEIADVADEALRYLGLLPVEDLPGTNAAVFEVRAAESVVFRPFAHAALAMTADENRLARFWCALRNLRAHGFLYETVAVWSADPVKDPNAEPWYTLYIKDGAARANGEPYLQRAIHKIYDHLEAQRVWRDDGPGLIELSNAGDGGFRFIGNKKRPGYPLGIFRLRFRPHDQETGLGFEREERRVSEWATRLRNLTG